MLKGGNLAGQYAIVENGRLNSKQTLDIGNSVRASLDASIWGDFGAASAMAEDADGNWAATWVLMKKGELSTVQGAEADGSATADQESNVVDAEWGVAESWAEDADGNWAETLVLMENGELSTKQEAEADGCATTGQESNVDAEWGVAASWAEDADDNWAETYVEMEEGTLSTKQEAEADGCATTGQESNVDAEWGVAASWAEDADGNWAETYVEMEEGTLSTIQGVEADGSAAAVQGSVANGTRIWLKTVAENQYGYTLIENEVENGTLNSVSEQ
jgi:hypothetical protein